MAPAMMAAIVLIRMSRFLTCDSSWAMTPSQFLVVEHLPQPGRHAHRAVVRVAAGGKGVGSRRRGDVDPGIGRPARWESRSTISQSAGSSSGEICWACIVARAILSLKKIGDQVHHAADDERRQQSPVRAADQVADAQAQAHQRAHQHRRLEVVPRICAWHTAFTLPIEFSAIISCIYTLSGYRWCKGAYQWHGRILSPCATVTCVQLPRMVRRSAFLSF